jgi:hypothetical protein
MNYPWGCCFNDEFGTLVLTFDGDRQYVCEQSKEFAEKSVAFAVEHEPILRAPYASY